VDGSYQERCIASEKDADEALKRVVELDAVRTFFGAEDRVKLVRFITVLRTHFKDYHQGLGYIAR
jgi:spore coat polysaccharide biosynthesis protein SpsF (cytidylyltransferase family)